jgi:Cupredoxin-like domain
MKRLLPALFLLATPAFADQVTEVHLKGHKFYPATITVQANQADEFDSSSLKIEKVVPGHQKGNIRVRPLAPGKYPFMGEYNAATAQGFVIAK